MAADGITPVNAPLTVWEPDGSTQTYTPSLNSCGALVNAGAWSPGVTAPMAALDTAGGTGSGTCSIALDDGSSATLSPGHGIVAATVVASPRVYATYTFYGTYCTGAACTGLPGSGGGGGTGGVNPCRKDCPGDGSVTVTNIRYYVSTDGGYTWSVVETIYDVYEEKNPATCTDAAGTTVPCASIIAPSPITYNYDAAKPAAWHPAAPPGTTGI